MLYILNVYISVSLRLVHTQEAITTIETINISITS